MVAGDTRQTGCKAVRRFRVNLFLLVKALLTVETCFSVSSDQKTECEIVGPTTTQRVTGAPETST